MFAQFDERSQDVKNAERSFMVYLVGIINNYYKTPSELDIFLRWLKENGGTSTVVSKPDDSIIEAPKFNLAESVKFGTTHVRALLEKISAGFGQVVNVREQEENQAIAEFKRDVIEIFRDAGQALGLTLDRHDIELIETGDVEAYARNTGVVAIDETLQVSEGPNVQNDNIPASAPSIIYASEVAPQQQVIASAPPMDNNEDTFKQRTINNSTLTSKYIGQRYQSQLTPEQVLLFCKNVELQLEARIYLLETKLKNIFEKYSSGFTPIFELMKDCSELASLSNKLQDLKAFTDYLSKNPLALNKGDNQAVLQDIVSAVNRLVAR